MKGTMSAIANSPIWTLLSVVVIAWITQKFIAYRERAKRLTDKQQDIYLAFIPQLAEFYQLALAGQSNASKAAEFEQKWIEIQGVLQIMGSMHVISAFDDYVAHVRAALHNGTAANEITLRKSYTHLNYAMCCDIHGEKYEDK